jgi:hypothetical protein
MNGMTTIMKGPIPLHFAIKEFYGKNKYPWQPRNILIARDTTVKADNTFQDCIAIVGDDGVFAARCAAVPGTKWTPEKRKQYGVHEGTICPGFYPNVWRFGQHHGKAFVQVGPIDWFEDTDFSKTVSKGERVVKSDVCAINIHRKMVDNAKTVDFASAGCVVPQAHKAIDEIIRLCGWTGERAPLTRFNGLIVEADFPFFKDLMSLI